MSRLSKVKETAKYPKLTARLELGDYNSELQGDYLEVWLNWSRDFNDRVLANQSQLMTIRSMPVTTESEREAYAKALERWLATAKRIYAEFWDCTVDDIQAIYDLDISLWDWVTARSLTLRAEYQEKRKKVGSSSGDT